MIFCKFLFYCYTTKREHNSKIFISEMPFIMLEFRNKYIFFPISHRIVIVIIMSRSQHGSHWLSFTTRLYRPLFPGVLQGYILYWDRTVEYWFFARPCEGVLRGRLLMSPSLHLQQCPACLVLLRWFSL